MDPYFILPSDDQILTGSPTHSQVIQEYQEVTNSLLVASGSAEVMEEVSLLQSSSMTVLQIPVLFSDHLMNKPEPGIFRVEEHVSTSSIYVTTWNVGTEATTTILNPPTEETLDNTQSNLASSREEPTTFSTEQLLTLAPRQKKAPMKRVPTELKNAKYYENRKKNAQAARLCRERKKKLDEERVKFIQSSLQEVEQLKKELEAYQPLEEKYSLLQNNYNILQQIVATFLVTKQQ